MKKPINESAKLRRLAGLITESEYQEEVMKSEEKIEEDLPVEDPRVEQIIQTLKDLDVDGETMEYIIQQVGMADQMANQLVHNKAELNERLEPHVYERMYNLSNIKAQQAMIKAAEILMNDLTAEGFEVPEIREFFTQLIANDI